jgi:integrase
MKSTKGPVKGTRAHHGRYFLLVSNGKKKTWIPLTRVTDGLPAFFRALADAKDVRHAPEDLVPRIISQWELEVMPAHAAKTQRDEQARNKIIAESFSEFTAAQVLPKDVAEFLKPFRDRPRTHNMYRAQLRELMRFSMEKGYRDPGTSPVSDIIPTMTTRARGRYITDSELRRIKFAALVATDRHGNRTMTRSGPMLCALLDVAYLTGQRIGDLLELRWRRADALDDGGDVVHPFIGDDGIYIKPSKTGGSSGLSVLVEWTPRLLDAVERLKELRKRRRGFTTKVFITQEGTPYTYWGASTAFRRAVKRAGVKGVTFHDVKAKALTDKDEREGIKEAQKMGVHTTEQQTADYVRHKKPRRTKATR